MSGDVPRVRSYGVPISQFVRIARCCTSVLDFHCPNLQYHFKTIDTGYRYHKLRKRFQKFFRTYSELLSKFGEISFQEYILKRFFHPVFYGDLLYKLGRVKGTAKFVSSGSKIVRHRKYGPVIIEVTIGLVLCSSTAWYRSFIKHCTLPKKAVCTIWWKLSEPPQRRQGPDPRPLWLLAETSLSLSSLRNKWSIAQSGGCLHIFLTYCFYHLKCSCNLLYGFSALIGCCSSILIRRIIYKLFPN